MAISVARVTRLGLSAYMTQPYGSFAGKTATEAAETESNTLFIKNIGRMMNR